MDLRETKFYTAGKTKELQEKLIEMGYSWLGNSKKYAWLGDSKELDDNPNPNAVFMFIDYRGYLSWTPYGGFFDDSNYKEVTAQDILDYEIPKKYWKDELQEGEYLINALLNKNPLVSCTPAHKGVEFFKDKDKAIHAIEVLKLHLEMLRFAELRNGDWKPDWKYIDQLKYGLVLGDGTVKIETYVKWNLFINQISFHSMGIAKEALEIFGDRIRELYNLKS